MQRITKNRPEYPQCHNQTDGNRNEPPQCQAVNAPATDPLSLVGDRNQGRFGNDSREPHGKAESEQDRHRPFFGKLVRQTLANRKDAQLKPLEEKRHANGDDQQAKRHAAKVVRDLLQDDQLEKGDDQNDRQQVFEGMQ